MDIDKNKGKYEEIDVWLMCFCYYKFIIIVRVSLPYQMTSMYGAILETFIVDHFDSSGKIMQKRFWWW